MKAIVVGAGIGGVTAAVGLERCGWQVTLLERAPELGEVGAGISIWPAALAALERLGVTGVERVSRQTGVVGWGRNRTRPEPAGMRRPDGRWIVEAADLGVELPVMIHRARLHELITTRFGPGVTVRTGVEVGKDEIGRSEADLVLLADGIRSTGRQYLYPDHPGPRYSGYTAYRGIADIDVADGGGESWGRGKRFGLVQLIDGRWYWYATANCPPGQPAGPGGHHADVVAQYGDWHYPIPELLAATPPDQVLRNDLYDLPLPLVPFRRGNVVLLGDAAHAMTPNLGRGACTAIEDADALSRCLTESPDLESALTRYDAERRPVATALVKRSRQVGVLGQLENPVATGLRDAVLTAGGRLARLRTRR